jgi:hypothetical protein
MASVVNPRPTAPKPAAPKTSYKTPTVIAKPSAPAPATKSSGATPKGGGQAASGSKLIQPIKTPIQTGGVSAYDKAKAELAKSIAEGKRLADLYNKNKKVEDGDGDGDGDGEDGKGGEDAGLAYSKMQDEKARQDAFAILRDVFSSYGLSELADQISGYMREGIGTGEATIRLKQSQPYKDRFYGNELRLAAGRNVINEAEYLDLENSYSETLKAYGLQSYFGTGVTPNERKNRQKSIASVIGADISAVEFKERVVVAVDRVKMADPATKNAFQQFYGIGEADLAQYFLDPTKNLVNLKEKATAAEIGGAAIGQGLSATMTSAEDLARFGINREQAQIGYGRIAEELPTTSKLSNVYSETGITYGQTDAEQATFKELASAKRKKERLKELEEGQFSGSSGTALGAGALSTQYLRKSSPAGQY